MSDKDKYTQCIKCGLPVACAVLHDPQGPYLLYCAEHVPEGDCPVNNQVDDLDGVTHD